MFRLSRMTDYGIVLLAHLASERNLHPEESAPQNARELAHQVGLPLPVVSKVLKQLARAGILESHRGAKGGFTLTRRPEDLSVAELVTALDGPVALTQCAALPGGCDHERTCAVRSPWQVINQVVQYALSEVSLADLVNPAFSAQHAPLASIPSIPFAVPAASHSESENAPSHDDARIRQTAGKAG
jgi:FeS assembly SUF system regulator